MDNSAPLHVVAAVIVESGRVMVTKRPPGGVHGGHWEFPGGKVEPGETPQQALARELEEELGVRARVLTPFREVLHRYPHLYIRLDAWLCRIDEGTPATIGVEQIRWETPENLSTLLMPEADLPIIDKLKNEIPR